MKILIILVTAISFFSCQSNKTNEASEEVNEIKFNYQDRPICGVPYELGNKFNDVINKDLRIIEEKKFRNSFKSLNYEYSVKDNVTANGSLIFYNDYLVYSSELIKYSIADSASLSKFIAEKYNCEKFTKVDSVYKAHGLNYINKYKEDSLYFFYILIPKEPLDSFFLIQTTAAYHDFRYKMWEAM